MDRALERAEWATLYDRITNTEDVQQCVVDISRSLEIDFITFHMDLNTVNTIGAPYIKTNFPADWVRRYLVMDYARIDPVMTQGFYLTDSCFWTDLQWGLPEHGPFLRDAFNHGVPKQGYIVPLQDQTNNRAMMSLASNCDADKWFKKVQKLNTILVCCAKILHAKAVEELSGHESDCPHLTQREIECMSWVARGKDAQSIAMILGISTHTVRDYCKSAKQKLGVQPFTRRYTALRCGEYLMTN